MSVEAAKENLADAEGAILGFVAKHMSGQQTTEEGNIILLLFAVFRSINRAHQALEDVDPTP